MKTTYRLLLACAIALAMALPAHATIVQFNGAIDLTYTNWGKDGQSGGIPTFDAYEVYLLGRADISENVSGYFELRNEHSEEAILRQGYLKWTLRDELAFSMGYFYTPIGQYWLRYYASTREFVTYAYPMRLINVTPWGEAGIMMSGNIETGGSARVNYALALINGLNEAYLSNKPRDARQTRDNNENKMVAGRLGIAPIEELEVGVSFAGGKFDDTGTGHLQLMDADFALTIADFTMRGEWVQSEADAGTDGETIKTSGYYVHAGYKILKDKFGVDYIMPLIRYESVDPGRDMKDVFTIGPESTGKISAISAGLDVSPVEHFLLKAEYRWTTEDLDPQLENDAFSFQACIDF